MTETSLQLKLKLLNTLQTGNINQIQTLISQIQSKTQINPELYNKFQSFITNNKQGLLEMEQEEKEENETPKIIIENVEGNIDDGEYDSDWTDSNSDEEEEVFKGVKSKEVLKEMGNKVVPKTAKVEPIRLKKNPTNPTLAFKKSTITKPSTTNLQRVSKS